MTHSLLRHYRTLRRRGLLFSAVFVAGVAVVSWIWLFAVSPQRERFTLYFSSNIHGLSVGAPVKMHGRDVGVVSGIGIISVPERSVPEKYYAAVTVELETDTLENYGRLRRGQTFGEALPQLLDIGLRGRLQMPSLLANGLCVNLYFDPGKPALRVNPPKRKHAEIPTNYTSSSEFVDQANAFIETRNLYGIAEKIRGLRALISDFAAATETLDCAELNADALHFLETANARLDSADARKKAAELNARLAELCENLETQEPIERERVRALVGTLRNLSEILREISGNAQAIRMQFSPENLGKQQRALEEFREKFDPLIRFGKALFL